MLASVERLNNSSSMASKSMSKGMPKDLEEAYLQRMPQELKVTLNGLSTDVRAAILKVLWRYHHVMEKETYSFIGDS